MRRGWLRDHLPKQPPQPRRARQAPSRFVPCDPLTGARLDPDDDLATDAYRPGAQLAALVRARDGRCRFPGCCVAARFCDLDHVRPWPAGRTTATNLLTLCRRHHRIKQRPGWRLRLAPDGTATFTDPTGRARTTAPLDALKSLVLTADAAPDRPATPPTPEAIRSATAWSALETHLEFTAEHHPHTHPEHHHWLPPTHHRCTSATHLRRGACPTQGLRRHASLRPADTVGRHRRSASERRPAGRGSGPVMGIAATWVAPLRWRACSETERTVGAGRWHRLRSAASGPG